MGELILHFHYFDRAFENREGGVKWLSIEMIYLYPLEVTEDPSWSDLIKRIDFPGDISKDVLDTF